MTDDYVMVRRDDYDAMRDALEGLVGIANKSCVGPWDVAKAALSRATAKPVDVERMLAEIERLREALEGIAMTEPQDCPPGCSACPATTALSRQTCPECGGSGFVEEQVGGCTCGGTDIGVGIMDGTIVHLSRSELVEVAQIYQQALAEVLVVIGPEPPDCGCSGCEVEMQMAIDVCLEALQK
jgi:hypothetical protein